MDAKLKISTQASCIDDEGVIWLFSNDFNALFSWKSGKVTYVTTFDDEDFFENVLYNMALNYGNNIFFFPVRAKKIACYSKSAKQVTYLEMPERKDNEYFNIIYKDVNQVWMFPVFKRDYAYILDMERKTVKRCGIHWNNIDISAKNSLIGDALLDECIYLAVSGTNSILKFNTESYECEKVEINEPLFRTHTYGNAVYTLDAYGHMVLQYTEGKTSVVLSRINRNTENKVMRFKNMEYVDFFPISLERMALLPMLGEGVCIADKNGDSIIATGKSGYQLYADILTYGEAIYLMPYEGDEMVTINSKTLDFMVTKLEIRLDEYREIMIKEMINEIKKKKILLSEGFVSLEDFIVLAQQI